MMDLSTLTCAAGARKKRKRVGRGPGCTKGKTCGRGHKGQKARSGYSRRHGFEGGQMPLNRRLPKRGFRHQDRHPSAIVNLDTLDRAFEAGGEVTPEAIVQAGLADACKGGVKILGRGELTKKLVVKAHEVTDGARKKIEATGGTVELIQIKPRPKDKSTRSGGKTAEER